MMVCWSWGIYPCTRDSMIGCGSWWEHTTLSTKMVGPKTIVPPALHHPSAVCQLLGALDDGLPYCNPQCHRHLWYSQVSVANRATLSYSVEGAVAATLDHVEEEEEEISFHGFHTNCMQAGGVNQQAGGSSQQVTPGPTTELEPADVTWRAARWLKD